MKFFASILSLYILMLTGMQCADLPGCDDHLKSDLTTHSADSRHHSTAHCSPFCTCDCCVTSVIQQDNNIYSESTDYTHRNYQEYSVSYVSTLFATIWQPPKIS